MIPNYGKIWRAGFSISTAFVESTVNLFISKRFAKKQQMQWTEKGIHLLMQIRAKTFNDESIGNFKQWYPDFIAEETTIAIPKKSKKFRSKKTVE